jgi:hypothetical protein
VTSGEALAQLLAKFFIRQMRKSFPQPVNKERFPKLGEIKRLQEALFRSHVSEDLDVPDMIWSRFDVHCPLATAMKYKEMSRSFQD